VRYAAAIKHRANSEEEIPMAQSPFLSARSARRVAAKQIAKPETRDQLNVALCEGRRSISLPVGLVDALAKTLNEAGGWLAVVEDRGDENGTVYVTHDPASPRKSDDNPLYSYEEVRRRSVEFVAKSAVAINAGLEEGRRAFVYPIGIVHDIMEALNAPIDGEPSGWFAKLGQTDKNAAVIIVKESGIVDAPFEGEVSSAAN
jgi:hypothetical protein